METEIEQAHQAVFNYFVDTLVDLADPDDDDRDITVDNMEHVTQLLFEGSELNVVSVCDGVLTIQMSFGG